MMSSNTMNLPRSKDTKWLRWSGKSSSSTRWIRTGNNDARETPDACEENEEFAA